MPWQTTHEAGAGAVLRGLKAEAVALMLEKYEIVQEMFYGFDYMRIFSASPKEKLTIVREGADFIFSQGRTEDERTQEKRFIQHVTKLSKAFTLSVYI